MDWDKVAREDKYKQGSKTKLAEDQSAMQLKYQSAQSDGPCGRCKKPIRIGQKIVTFAGSDKALHKNCFKKS